MVSTAIEKLANLINYMQNLKPKLNVAPQPRRNGIHVVSHGKSNYIPVFTVDSGCGVGPSRRSKGQRARALCCGSRRHPLEHRWTVSPEPVAVARDLENESG